MNKKNLSLFRYLVQVVVLLCLTGLTVYMLEPVRRHIGEQMEDLRHYAVDSIEERLGRAVSYDSISPSIISRFEIRGFKVHHSPGRPQSGGTSPGSSGAGAGDGSSPSGEDTLLSFESVVVRYRLLPILLGSPEDALRELRVRNTTIDVDTQRDHDLIEWIGGLLNGDAVSDDEDDDPLLPDNVILSARNMDISITDNSGSLSINNLFASVRQAGADALLSVRADVSGNHDAAPHLGSVGAELAADVSIGPDVS
ncbi:MAG: hypothetical protein ACOCRN_01510, partial [Spirochaetia bacterium]